MKAERLFRFKKQYGKDSDMNTRKLLSAGAFFLSAVFCCGAGFDASKLHWKLPKTARMEKREGKTFLKVSVPPNGKGVHCATAELDLKPYTGKMLELSIPVRGKTLRKSGISGRAAPKFMLKYNNVIDETLWPGAKIPEGTFDWRRVSLRISQFKGSGSLYLGFQEFTGDIEFELSAMELNTSDVPVSVKALIPVRPDVMLEGGTPLGKLEFQLNDFAKRDGKILAVTVQDNRKKGINAATAEIDLGPYADKVVQISVLARGRGLSSPPGRGYGVHFALSVPNFTGKKAVRASRTRLYSDFEWKLVSVEAQVGAAGGRLSLGLKDVSGSVDFDLDSLNIRPLYSRENDSHKAVYDERVTGQPQLRGVMLPQKDLKREDLETLAKWNVNLVRFQFCRFWMKPHTDRDLEDYDKWFESRFDNLKWLVSEAGKHGIRVVIDMHTPPGGRKRNKDMCLFSESFYADHFIRLWKRIATEFKGNPNVWAYDLLNEPQSRLKNGFDWWKLQLITAEAIRKIDPDTPIMVATNWGNGTWCWDEQRPFELKNIIYQFHMYNPMAFTHQFRTAKEGFKTYPGKFGRKNEFWDKEKLRESMKDVRAFQLKHGVRIYAGEFSAVAWAPGADKYLKDCIELFEEYGWDWSYHSFREAPCWSLEMEGEPRKMRPSENNPRKQVVLDGFRKNKNQVSSSIDV